MSCFEKNRQTIIRLDAIASDKVSLDYYNRLVSQAPLIMEQTLKFSNQSSLFQVLAEPSSITIERTSEFVRGGTKQNITIEFDSTYSQENETDVLNQFNILTQKPHSFVVTYFGDYKEFIYSMDNAMTFKTEDKNGKIHCIVTIVNLTGIESIKSE